MEEAFPKEPYRSMYTLLFNAITDALAALEGVSGAQPARALLAQAQGQAEEIFLEQGS